MSPLGKFTLALIGLRFFGAAGFFVGLWLGHMLIDRTLIIRILERYLGMIDDNIRLLLPYRYYRYYNRIDGNFWGKIWGSLLGSLLWGLNGFILLFILGHFVFDTPNSRHARAFRKNLDDFWDRWWVTIAGAVLGFVCRSRLLLFCGVILGFFADFYRVENASLLPFQKLHGFWYRLNPLKFWQNSKEARHFAFISACAGLAAKVAKADGQVSSEEIRVFKKIFAITDAENSKIATVFNRAKTTARGYESFARQLAVITGDNLELKETVLDNLFKIASADGIVKGEVLAMLEKIAALIELPAGNFSVISDMYQPKNKNTPLQQFYDLLGVLGNASDCEIKRRWKELIVLHHPDRLQNQGANAEEIAGATAKMAEINNAYQTIMKARRVI